VVIKESASSSLPCSLKQPRVPPSWRDSWRCFKEGVEAVYITFLLARGGERVCDVGREKGVKLFQQAVKYLHLLFKEEGISASMKHIKLCSVKARRAWVLHEELSIESPLYALVANVGRYDIWGGLSRGLPVPPEECVEDAVKANRSILTSNLTRPVSSDSVREIVDLLEEWAKQADGLIRETVPYTESACLICPRRKGGNAGVIRSVLCALRLEHAELADVPDPLLSPISYKAYQSKCFRMLVETLYKWDSRVLSGLRARGLIPFNGLPHSELGLPDTGFRIRACTIPWPSIYLYQEPVRRWLWSGMKKDKVGGLVLNRGGYGKISKLTKPAKGIVIDSTDMQDATNNFPHELLDGAIDKLSGHVPDYLIAPLKNTARSYLLKGKLKKDLEWPGLEHFLQQCGAGALVHSTFETRSGENKAPTLNAFGERLYSGIYNHPWYKKLQEKAEYFSRLRYKAQKCRSIYHWAPTKDVINIPWVVPGASERSGIGGNFSTKVIDLYASNAQGEAYIGDRVKRFTFLPANFRLFLRKQNEEVVSPLRLMEEFYKMSLQDVLLSSEPILAGQLMSQPLSWIVLNAANVAAVRTSGCQGVTLGDDALLRGTWGQVNKAHDFIRSFGALIHPLKDMISRDRAVFAEYLLESGEYHDIPKAATITQPKVPSIQARWSQVGNVAKSGAVKYLTPSEKKLVIGLLYDKYNGELECARRLGIPITSPISRGGLGIPGASMPLSRFINGIEDIPDPYLRIAKWREIRTLYVPKVYRGFGSTNFLFYRPELVHPSDPEYRSCMTIDKFEDKLLHRCLFMQLMHTTEAIHNNLRGRLTPARVMGRLMKYIRGLQPTPVVAEPVEYRVRGPVVDLISDDPEAPIHIWLPTH
jgi:hypothetical protein